MHATSVTARQHARWSAQRAYSGQLLQLLRAALPSRSIVHFVLVFLVILSYVNSPFLHRNLFCRLHDIQNQVWMSCLLFRCSTNLERYTSLHHSEVSRHYSVSNAVSQPTIFCHNRKPLPPPNDCPYNLQGGPKNEATLHFPKYLENY